MSPLKFLEEVRAELVRVDWPSREQTMKLTLLVLISSVVVGSYIGGLDTLFTLLFKNLVK